MSKRRRRALRLRLGRVQKLTGTWEEIDSLHNCRDFCIPSIFPGVHPVWACGVCYFSSVGRLCLAVSYALLSLSGINSNVGRIRGVSL